MNTVTAILSFKPLTTELLGIYTTSDLAILDLNNKQEKFIKLNPLFIIIEDYALNLLRPSVIYTIWLCKINNKWMRCKRPSNLEELFTKGDEYVDDYSTNIED